ncbi:hypothetical protein [Mycolicibacter senuensis]|uniref:hypothetical protein n=1 Tax=Mycolicibacter senuensis TaxID=386913 RepID=UPI000DCF25A2|nr:hypothetical protein [Mycolicibacter senuensis]RAU92536.1 hypothetical protein DQP56_20310 [Mycolicibacter senuensis]
MLIIALVLAAIGLAALVFAVVTSNALVAWVCIVASLLGVLLLIVDALRERRGVSRPPAPEPGGEPEAPDAVVDEDDEAAAETAEAADEADEAADEADEAVVADYDDEAAEETADEEPVAHPAD